MASMLARAKLARQARRLNACCSRPLPALILMTDDKRVPDPLHAARKLPKGSAIILRHRNDRERARLAEAFLKLARQCDLLLLIAGDQALAHRMDADGVHFPESQLSSLAPCRTRHPNWIITAAAHSEHALLRASRSGVDAALLAPLFHTKSHPERNEFGVARFRLLAARAPIPVYALGGVTAANAGRLAAARVAGIAAIDGVLPD